MNTYNFLLIGLIAIFVVVFFIKKGTRGLLRSFDYFERYFEWLIVKGYGDAFLILEHDKSNTFLQFHRYEKNKIVGIELGFPRAKWSEKYYDALKDYCQSNGYKYSSSRGSDRMEFLNVDFGDDTKSAFIFSKRVMMDIFNIPESDKFRGTLENCSPQ